MPDTSEKDEMDKERLLRQMYASYERVESALDALMPTQWLTPRAPDVWSARDIVAHLTYWLDRVADELNAVGREKPPKEPAIGLSPTDINAANALAVEEHQDDTPQQARGAFRRSFGQVVDMLRPLPWDDLAAVGRYKWLGQTPLWHVVAEHTWEHFDEHLPDLEQASGASRPGDQD